MPVEWRWPDKDDLQEVARRVAELIPPNSRRREWFLHQIRSAIKDQIAHDDAHRKQSRDLALHFRHLQRTPRLREKTDDPPEDHPDWKWDMWLLPTEHFRKREIRDLRCGNRPPPDEWILGWGPTELQDESSVPPEPIPPFYPFGDGEQPREQVLRGLCFILAVVHDFDRGGWGRRLLLEGIDLPPRLRVCLEYPFGRSYINANPDGSDRRAVSVDPDRFVPRHHLHMAGFDCETLERALEAVKEGIAELEAGERSEDQGAEGMAGERAAQDADKQQSWVDNAPRWASAKEIIDKYEGTQIDKTLVIRLDFDKLRRFVKRHGLRVMRKGQRVKIHKGEMQQAIRQFGKDLTKTEATPEFLEDVKAALTTRDRDQTWECAHCRHIVQSSGRPPKCPECGKNAMTTDHS